MGGVVLCLLKFPSCASDNEKVHPEAGIGVLSFDIDANVAYKTKAVNENDYQNVDNYMVEIFNDGVSVKKYEYGKMPLKIEIGAGNYVAKAYMGIDLPASTTDMYVEGQSNFTIQAGETTETTVVCKPVCAKIIMEYDPEMDSYFSNYGVEFQTTAIGAGNTFPLLNKKTDPVYLRVGADENITVKLLMTKKSDGSTATSVTSYKLSPLTALTLKVKPMFLQGNLGLNVTVDDSTNDKDITVELPADWVSATK